MTAKGPNADSLDDVGRFWLPGDPENKVHGSLVFDPETGGRLRLDGLLGIDGRSDGHERILGQSQASGGYTLERCLETSRKGSISSSPTGVSEWHVGEVFTNIHFSESEDLEFDTILVDLEDMSSWLGRNGIAGAGLQPVDGTWKATIEGVKQEDDTFATDFGELTIYHWLGERNQLPREFSIWQAHGVKIKTPGLVSKDELLEIASDVQDIVSMGIGRLSAYSRVRFGHPHIVRQTPAGTPYRIDVEHFANWRIKTGEYTEPPRRIVFSYEDIGSSAGLRTWLSIASQHRKVLGRLMGTRELKGMYSEDRLFNAVAAAEGLHRELTGLPDNRNETTLQVRLIHLAQLAGQEFETAVVNVEKWSEFLKEERHEHAHNRNQRPSSNVDYYWHMANSAYWVVVLCLLRQIPAAGPAIAQATNSQSFRFMAEEVGKVVTLI